jgi:hypothetical protein
MSDKSNISLQEIWAINQPEDYKVHFGRWNGDEQPLEAWVRDHSLWQRWQETRPKRNEFNRPLIFSLMSFYHEPDVWLFGGIFRVLERHEDRYEVELSDDGASFIGRLKLKSAFRGRGTRLNFENHYGEFEVQEVLREQYSGRSFPGYDDIDLSFDELETIVQNQSLDWRTALESVKGVYLITDAKTGKRYVGAAYSDHGIWSRWSTYIASGHGGNVELRALVKDPSLDYCRSNFRFALLEDRPARTPDDVIQAREVHWKRILLTRGEGGLNRN